MLDLENYKPNYYGHRCKECTHLIRQGNPYSRRITLRCSKKPFYIYGQKSYHKTKANNPACIAFQNVTNDNTTTN